MLDNLFRFIFICQLMIAKTPIKSGHFSLGSTVFIFCHSCTYKNILTYTSFPPHKVNTSLHIKTLYNRPPNRPLFPCTNASIQITSMHFRNNHFRNPRNIIIVHSHAFRCFSLWLVECSSQKKKIVIL